MAEAAEEAFPWLAVVFVELNVCLGFYCRWHGKAGGFEEVGDSVVLACDEVLEFYGTLTVGFVAVSHAFCVNGRDHDIDDDACYGEVGEDARGALGSGLEVVVVGPEGEGVDFSEVAYNFVDGFDIGIV